MSDGGAARAPGAWLFSREVDLLAFGAPALAALVIVAVGLATGAASGETPPGLWLAAVVGVDVAHVWSTAYRVYADPAELRRRPGLYLGAPVLAYAAGVVLHLWSPLLFWRVLAYTAVFHFIRQQYGWVMLYRRRAGERGQVGRWVDGAAIYAATVVPLVSWHASLPRRFHWFLPGDFVAGLPAGASRVAGVLYAVIAAAYVAQAIGQARSGVVPWGKHLVVGSTALCWWLGIVVFDSDFVFTVTNVLIHGVPYFVLVYRWGRRRFEGVSGGAAAIFRAGVPAFYGLLLAVAFVEEGVWDVAVWHDHPRIFGAFALAPGAPALAVLVPLLALPQAVHYLLDAFVWKVGPRNPGLAERLGLG